MLHVAVALRQIFVSFFIILLKHLPSVFRSTSESQPNSIEGKNVRPPVRPQKVSSI